MSTSVCVCMWGGVSERACVYVCARSVQGPLAAVRGEWRFLMSLLVHSSRGRGRAGGSPHASLVGVTWGP